MSAACATLRRDLGLGLLRERKRERHVVAHRHVRIERVVLEHHRDVALLRRHAVDDVAADRDLALADLLEPRDHAQQRRLAAARRTDQHAELAVGDLDVDAADHVRRSEPLVHCADGDACHVASSSRVLGRDVGYAFRPRDDVVGPPGARASDQILRRLAPQLALGLDRIERRVRRQDHPRMAEQPRSRAAPARPAARRARAPRGCPRRAPRAAASTSTTAPRAVLTR